MGKKQTGPMLLINLAGIDKANQTSE
jgi:hypothetical protein